MSVFFFGGCSRMSEAASRQVSPALEKAYQFLVWLIPTLDKFPRRQKFLLGDRIESTALDVLEGLVEATYTHNRGRLLEAVNLKLDKLRLLFRLSAELQLLDSDLQNRSPDLQIYRRPADAVGDERAVYGDAVGEVSERGYPARPLLCCASQTGSMCLSPVRFACGAPALVFESGRAVSGCA